MRFRVLLMDLSSISSGQATGLRLTIRGWAETIPVTFAPHGWLAGLLHLMAVAGASPSTIIAIDEFENSLHPMRSDPWCKRCGGWAAERDLTVVLAGTFAGTPGRVPGTMRRTSCHGAGTVAGNQHADAADRLQ